MLFSDYLVNCCFLVWICRMMKAMLWRLSTVYQHTVTIRRLAFRFISCLLFL